MFKYSFSHPFDLRKSLDLAKQAVAYYQKKYPRYTIHLLWISEKQAELRIDIHRLSIHGLLTLEDKRIDASLSIPLVLRPFREQGLQKIEAEMKRWFYEEETLI